MLLASIFAYPLKVNIGDLMETYTNGLFPATRHRVVVPVEEVRRRKARQSLAVFLHPDRSEVARPIHGEEPNSSKYCLGINAAEYKFRQFARKGKPIENTVQCTNFYISSACGDAVILVLV